MSNTIPLPESNADSASGRTLGRYRDLVEVGRGGMSVVYRAHDPALRRDVALKLLAPALSGDAQALERFRREATSVASLKHPNIALVYEFGEHDGQPFIAFEWIAGENLRALLDREGRLPIARALHIFDQVAAALAYAHERGVIHRDVKPANIIANVNANANASGTGGVSATADLATLVDFGLAWMADLPRVTSTGTFFGTPLYMAPEQIQGLQLDQRTDLYSLAFVLYEMLAGRPPFDAANTPALLNRHLHATPDPLTEVNPSLPAAIDTVFKRATAKAPADRYPDVPAFQRAVHAALGASPVTQASTVSGAPAMLRRYWRWLAAIGAGAVALAALFVATRPAAAPPAAATAAVQASATPALATATALPAPTEAPAAEATATDAPAPQATLDPNDTWMHEGYNSARNRFVNGIVPSRADAPRWTAQVEGEIGDKHSLVLARGVLIASYSNGSVTAFKADNGDTLWTAQLTGTLGALPAICCQWDNATVMLPLDDGQLVALNMQDGVERWRLDGETVKGGIQAGMTLGDDGLVYALTRGGFLLALNGHSGEVIWSLDLSGDEPTAQPALTNAGIYVLSAKNAVIAIDRAKHDVVWRAELPAPARFAPAVSGDGGAIIVALEDKQVLSLSSLSGKLLWQATANDSVAGIAADWGRVIATCYDGSVHTWQLADGKVLWQVNIRDGIELPPLTDAQKVLAVDRNGNTRAFEVETGLELQDYRYKLDGLGLAANAPALAHGWVFVQAGNLVHAYAP